LPRLDPLLASRASTSFDTSLEMDRSVPDVLFPIRPVAVRFVSECCFGVENTLDFYGKFTPPHSLFAKFLRRACYSFAVRQNMQNALESDVWRRAFSSLDVAFSGLSRHSRYSLLPVGNLEVR
jgi:hypothetical protein